MPASAGGFGLCVCSHDVFLQHVRASVRVAEPERLHADVHLGVQEKALDDARVEAAYNRRAPPHLAEKTVAPGDDPASVGLVLAAHLEQRLEADPPVFR